MSLFLKIVSPSKKIFDDEIQKITLPGTKGSFTILPRHAPIISSLKEGVIKYTTSAGEQELAITGGFIEMNENLITVCVTTVT